LELFKKLKLYSVGVAVGAVVAVGASVGVGVDVGQVRVCVFHSPAWAFVP